MAENEKRSNVSDSWVQQTTLYREFLAEREEIMKHKWLESEKAGHDIGFERALVDWVSKYRAAWRKFRQAQIPNKTGGN